MIGVQRATDPVVQGQGEQAPHLVGEDQGLTVLGEGDEAYRPHALPPSRRWPTTRDSAPGRVSKHRTRPGHPMVVSHAVELIDLQR